MAKRKIKPHKGGRDQRIPNGRLSSSERARLLALLEKNNETMADWIMRHVVIDEQDGGISADSPYTDK